MLYRIALGLLSLANQSVRLVVVVSSILSKVHHLKVFCLLFSLDFWLLLSKGIFHWCAALFESFVLDLDRLSLDEKR